MTAVVGVCTHFLDEAPLFSDEDGVDAFVAAGESYSRGWWRVETMIVEDGTGYRGRTIWSSGVGSRGSSCEGREIVDLKTGIERGTTKDVSGRDREGEQRRPWR